MDQYSGILPVIKEPGMSSHDVIYRLRRITGQQRIGHTGTLDPQAAGLLVICLGRATKLTQFLTDWDKKYRAEITLGCISDTLDGAGCVQKSGDVPPLSAAELDRILARFVGVITQTVPAFSAVKVGGRELYKYARNGESPTAPERQVEIKTLDMVSFETPRVTLDVHCSKGTYIRTLADDIGRAIGCGAYLSQLERMAVGPFGLADALSLAEVAERHEAGILSEAIRSIEDVLPFPVVAIRDDIAATIRNGGVPVPEDVVAWPLAVTSGGLFGLTDERGEVLAIGRSTCDLIAPGTQVPSEFFAYVRVLV